ncbi:MAG: hypothetical protein Q7K13_07155, partial [Polynucleobacter sp.]|uniref:hypothetical protein n=1 Tax=Polynucleobacter sp. TaxID=2029855 RepID=UPI002717EEC9
MVTTKKPTAKAIEKSKVEQAETLAIERKAKAALKPSVNGASVIQVFQENVMGKDTDINGLIEGLEATCK